MLFWCYGVTPWVGLSWRHQEGNVGYVSTKWVKFPSFVQYANEQRHFLVLTSEALQWANLLATPAVKGGGGRLPWTPEEAWEQLRRHQVAFRRLLDALIDGRPTRAQMQVLTEHCNHMRHTIGWDDTPELRRKQAAQRYEDDERWEGLRQKLRSRGHPGDIGESPQRPPLSRYNWHINAQDPLDALYWELHQFLDKEGQSRLRQCRQCERYFVQATARRQSYCMTSCQQKANTPKAQNNAEYQRQHRKRKIEKDLQKITAAKKKLRSQTATALMEEWVLEETKLTKRRFNALGNWEIKQYGHRRVTDLTA